MSHSGHLPFTMTTWPAKLITILFADLFFQGIPLQIRFMKHASAIKGKAIN